MKSTRALVMILFSLLAGAAAVWLAARWVGQQAASNTTPVVVAMRDIEPWEPLKAAQLQEIAWPVASVPLGTFAERGKLDGRVAAVPIFKGEPVLASNLAPEGAAGGLTSAIQSGMRAITVQVNEIVGVAGYIRPGSLVDLMVNTREGTDKTVSKIVLEKLLVLAVAQDDKRDQTKPKVVSAVTLEVTPQQAEKIDLARNVGTIALILRNSLDRADVATGGARRDDLMSRSASSPTSTSTPTGTPAPASAAVTGRTAVPVSQPRQAATRGSSVEVIRGVQKANTDF